MAVHGSQPKIHHINMATGNPANGRNTENMHVCIFNCTDRFKGKRYFQKKSEVGKKKGIGWFSQKERLWDKYKAEPEKP